MIRPDQITAYDDASKVISKAADLLDTINVAKIDRDDTARLNDAIKTLRQLRAEFFHAGHDSFLRERGLK